MSLVRLIKKQAICKSQYESNKIYTKTTRQFFYSYFCLQIHGVLLNNYKRALTYFIIIKESKSYLWTCRTNIVFYNLWGCKFQISQLLFEEAKFCKAFFIQKFTDVLYLCEIDINMFLKVVHQLLITSTTLPVSANPTFSNWNSVSQRQYLLLTK